MSSSNNKTYISYGIGLSGFVFLIFLTLKLAELGVVASWSWLWVFSPLWLPSAVVLGCIGAFIVGVFIAKIIATILAGTANMRVKRLYQDQDD